MTVRDSSYTNPDKLRELYINPKNPLRALEEDSSAAQLVSTNPSLPISGLASGGGNAGGEVIGGGSGGSGCPILTDYVLIRDASGNVAAIQSQFVKAGDYLYNPITGEFRKAIYSEILRRQPCVRNTTFDGAEQIVSLSHPVIQSFSDTTGLPVEEMLKDQTRIYGAVSVFDYTEAAETDLELVVYIGLRDVQHITLEGAGGGIYASGTKPTATILGHNKPRDPGDVPVS